MITKIADLLNELRIAEAERIDQQQIKHTTTIGDMYEGLTTAVLERAIPKQADLRIVSGFAEANSGVMSGQLDCMLVSGCGRQLPYSKASVWNIRDVLAVVEVKKTLFSAQVESAHDQLRQVLDLCWDDFQNSATRDLDIGPALQAYRLITGLEPPAHSDVGKLPFHLEMLYRTLVVELVSPVRIIFGYSGFKSEPSMRKAFFDFLEKHAKEPGFGGSALPDLIVCGQFSLVKLNGLPFTSPMKGDRWLIYGSSHQNPLYFLLELIWTRLSHRFTMPDWFMSDLTVGQLSPVLSGRAVQQGELSGWEYWTHSPELLPSNEILQPASWKPVAVSEFGFYVFSELCARQSLPQVPEYTGATEQEKEEFQRMINARIIGYDGDNIVLLTDSAMSVIAPDGNSYVGENSTGRLSAWLEKTFPRRLT
jgi:hypothetical protein